MNFVAQTLGVKPSDLLGVLSIVGVALVIMGVFEDYVANAVGVAYPLFMSFLALETETKDDDK